MNYLKKGSSKNQAFGTCLQQPNTGSYSLFQRIKKSLIREKGRTK
jgi:hypothetical protein